MAASRGSYVQEPAMTGEVVPFTRFKKGAIQYETVAQKSDGQAWWCRAVEYSKHPGQIQVSATEILLNLVKVAPPPVEDWGKEGAMVQMGSKTTTGGNMGHGLENASLEELYQAIEKHKSRIPVLQLRRKELLGKVQEIDDELAMLGVSGPKHRTAHRVKNGRGRVTAHKQEHNGKLTILGMLLKHVPAQQPKRLEELTELLKKEGWQTKATNPGMVIANCMTNNPRRFTSDGKGNWVMRSLGA
jgi:hypothetical protein